MTKPPESKDSTFDEALGDLREGIDSVDNQLVQLTLRESAAREAGR